MTTQLAILLDERGERLGTTRVPPAVSVIQHNGAYFARTDMRMRPNPRLTPLAIVFDQTEPYVRNKLEKV